MEKKKVSKKTAKKTVKKVAKVAPSVVEAPVVPVVKQLSVPEKIWQEIKDVRLDMFGLPNQFVHTYYKPLFLDPVKLHMAATTYASSALSVLEVALSPKFTIEQADKYVIVSLAPAK